MQQGRARTGIVLLGGRGLVLVALVVCGDGVGVAELVLSLRMTLLLAHEVQAVGF